MEKPKYFTKRQQVDIKKPNFKVKILPQIAKVGNYHQFVLQLQNRQNPQEAKTIQLPLTSREKGEDALLKKAPFIQLNTDPDSFTETLEKETYSTIKSAKTFRKNREENLFGNSKSRTDMLDLFSNNPEKEKSSPSQFT